MKKKILKKLLNNLPLKILSILIAIVIWYVVVSVNDPIVKERFDVPVQVTNEAYIAAGKKTYRWIQIRFMCRSRQRAPW